MPEHDLGAVGRRLPDGTVPARTESRPDHGDRTDFLGQLRDAAASDLPGGWFEPHPLGDDNFDDGRDHCMLERVGGPPVGSFHLWHADGSACARMLPELPPVDDRSGWEGRFRTVTEAVRAVAGIIDAQLRAWSLPPSIASDHPDGDVIRCPWPILIPS